MSERGTAEEGKEEEEEEDVKGKEDGKEQEAELKEAEEAAAFAAEEEGIQKSCTDASSKGKGPLPVSEPSVALSSS